MSTDANGVNVAPAERAMTAARGAKIGKLQSFRCDSDPVCVVGVGRDDR